MRPYIARQLPTKIKKKSYLENLSFDMRKPSTVSFSKKSFGCPKHQQIKTLSDVYTVAKAWINSELYTVKNQSKFPR